MVACDSCRKDWTPGIPHDISNAWEVGLSLIGKMRFNPLELGLPHFSDKPT